MGVVSFTNLDDVRRHLEGGDEPLVVIPVYNAYSDVLACFESVLRNTQSSVPILIVDDAGGDSRSLVEISISPLADKFRIAILHHQVNSGFVGSCNDAFLAGGRRDVILVNSDVIVGPEWCERLSDAAKSSSTIATASTLTNHGTMLSVPDMHRPNPQLAQGHTPESAARSVARWSMRTRPTIPTAVGHCVYVKRVALDLVGGFDPVFGRGYGEEVDFSQRCVMVGMRHVTADDVFVFHRGGGSFGQELSTQQHHNEHIVNGRYPWYRSWVEIAERDRFSPLTAALVRASVGLRGMSVAVDGRALGPDLMGTQQVIIETVRTLVQHEDVSRVVVYVSGPVPGYARERLSDSRIDFVHVADPHNIDVPLCDIAYRPYQAWGVGDASFLRRIGRWTAVNQLDCIAYLNPAYFPNASEWLIYRATTRAMLGSVDGIAYLSQTSRDEAKAEGLVRAGTPEKVVYTGAQFEEITQSTRPRQLEEVHGPLVLLIGVSYLHKNRVFALEMLEHLVEAGWTGKFVFAGLNPPAGGSTGLESGHFLRNPRLREHVVVLPAVSEDEKRWLFENSELMVYPSVVEGFGLVPFEAARYGLATVSTRQGSLDEVLPPNIPAFENFDVVSASATLHHLLVNPSERANIVRLLNERAEKFTSELTTHLLVELFTDMISTTPSRVVAFVNENETVTSWHPGAIANGVPRVVPPGLLVRAGWRFTRLKRIISPDGSRRQLSIRKLSNRVRTVLKR